MLKKRELWIFQSGKISCIFYFYLLYFHILIPISPPIFWWKLSGRPATAQSALSIDKMFYCFQMAPSVTSRYFNHLRLHSIDATSWWQTEGGGSKMENLSLIIFVTPALKLLSILCPPCKTCITFINIPTKSLHFNVWWLELQPPTFLASLCWQ